MRSKRAESLTLTVEQVAGQLGISRSLAYELAAQNELPVPTFRLGKRLVVSRVALERVLSQTAADVNNGVV